MARASVSALTKPLCTPHGTKPLYISIEGADKMWLVRAFQLVDGDLHDGKPRSKVSTQELAKTVGSRIFFKKKERETQEKRSFLIAQSEHAGARKVGVDSTSVCGLKLLGLVV